MKLDDLTKVQRSLILYLETRIVDRAGRLDSRHLNKEDRDQLKVWNADGFIQYGRIVMEDCNSDGSTWVEFSEEAWDVAHAERRARGHRMLESRNYTRTNERHHAG